MAAAETARLVASLELQDRNFTRGLTRVEKGIGRVDKRLGAFSGFLNRNMARALDSIAARGVDALGDAVQAGSDLNEEITKSQAVFGKSSKAIIEFSETTSTALGLSQKDALAAAGNFGNMFKTIGLGEGTSAKFSERLVGLAADMASFNNEDPTEMLDRIRSGLAGEAEPLRRFGVLLSAARVQEEAYASGIAKRGEKLTEAQKVQARYNLILKDTAVQQGDVAKTGGNLAGQQRKLNAMMQDLSATVGTALLPAVTDLTSEFVKLFSDPKTKQAIKDFAKELGEGAKDLVQSLKQVNWRAFADALGTAAGFARDLVKAFLGLPTWLQTAVITGWGLNKVTGGLITDLASGLIKGVLGMNAGVVNINAGVVNGGGVPLPGGKGGPGLLGTAARLVVPVAIASITLAASKTLTDAINPSFNRRLNEGDVPLGNRDPRRFDKFGRVVNEFEGDLADAGGKVETLGVKFGRMAPKVEALGVKFGRVDPKKPAGGREGLAFDEAHRTQEQANARIQAVKNAVKNAQSIASRENSAQKEEIARTKQAAATAGRNTTMASNRIPPSVRSNAVTVSSSMSAAASRIVTAVNALDLSVNVTTVNRTSTINNRYGPSGGSSTTNRSGELE